MSRPVFFEPEASAEFQEAALWYEAQRPGLGLAFLAAVDRTVEHLSAWPETGTAVPGVSASLSVRKLPVFRFPYHLAYVIAADDIRVLAVAHDRRRPGYWKPRTKP